MQSKARLTTPLIRIRSCGHLQCPSVCLELNGHQASCRVSFQRRVSMHMKRGALRGDAVGQTLVDRLLPTVPLQTRKGRQDQSSGGSRVRPWTGRRRRFSPAVFAQCDGGGESHSHFSRTTANSPTSAVPIAIFSRAPRPTRCGWRWPKNRRTAQILPCELYLSIGKRRGVLYNSRVCSDDSPEACHMGPTVGCTKGGGYPSLQLKPSLTLAPPSHI